MPYLHMLWICYSPKALDVCSDNLGGNRTHFALQRAYVVTADTASCASPATLQIGLTNSDLAFSHTLVQSLWDLRIKLRTPQQRCSIIYELK
jgi:hypothetical protein